MIRIKVSSGSMSGALIKPLISVLGLSGKGSGIPEQIKLPGGYPFRLTVRITSWLYMTFEQKGPVYC